MIERMLANTLLVLGVAMLVLVIDFRFRKYSRLLLWAEGLVAIIGSLLGVGLGWIRLFMADGYPNFPVVMVVTVVFCAGALFIILAEKQHKKAKEQTPTPLPAEGHKPTETEPPANEPKQEEISADIRSLIGEASNISEDEIAADDRLAYII